MDILFYFGFYLPIFANRATLGNLLRSIDMYERSFLIGGILFPILMFSLIIILVTFTNLQMWGVFISFVIVDFLVSTIFWYSFLTNKHKISNLKDLSISYELQEINN